MKSVLCDKGCEIVDVTVYVLKALIKLEIKG
jgi:hypothetical protein